MCALGIYLKSIQSQVISGSTAREAGEPSQAPLSVPQCDGHSLDDGQ